MNALMLGHTTTLVSQRIMDLVTMLVKMLPKAWALLPQVHD